MYPSPRHHDRGIRSWQPYLDRRIPAVLCSPLPSVESKAELAVVDLLGDFTAARQGFSPSFRASPIRLDPLLHFGLDLGDLFLVFLDHLLELFFWLAQRFSD